MIIKLKKISSLCCSFSFIDREHESHKQEIWEELITCCPLIRQEPHKKTNKLGKKHRQMDRHRQIRRRVDKQRRIPDREQFDLISLFFSPKQGE